MNNYWANAVTIAGNVRVTFKEIVPDARRETWTAYATPEIAQSKKV